MTDKPFSHDEDNRFSARVGRYARTSVSMANIAATLAGGKLSNNPDDKQVRAQDVKKILGSLRGPLMKVAQLLATIPEALPPEYAQELAQLQSNAPPMGWPFVRRRMVTELGANWQSNFTDFSKSAVAAASLGQVHKATLASGETLACKLQYPDMASVIAADVSQLTLLLSLFEKYDKSVNTTLVIEEITQRLNEELDYKREAVNTRLYGDMLAKEKAVHVPTIHDELSTGRLLTSQWMDGKPILSFKDATIEQRNEIALNLFRAWYVPFYHYGVIHGDPHLGNYSIREDNSINLLDYGCIRIFPPEFVKGVIDLYSGLSNDDRDLIVHAFETWGFTGLSNEIIDTLTLWARFLYGPLLENKKRIIGKAKGGIYGRELAREVHHKLREHGGITIPREFVFMDRAALGLGSVFIHLQAEINWHELFHSLIQDFSLEKLAARQNALLAKYNLTR